RRRRGGLVARRGGRGGGRFGRSRGAGRRGRRRRLRGRGRRGGGRAGLAARGEDGPSGHSRRPAQKRTTREHGHWRFLPPQTYVYTASSWQICCQYTGGQPSVNRWKRWNTSTRASHLAALCGRRSSRRCAV